MTFQDFMLKHKLKNSSTVRSWIEKGYIPGADYNENFIPDEAKPPYVRAKAKKPGKIYISIVRAIVNGYRPIPDKYETITEKEFYDIYMASLVSSGIIIAHTDTTLGVTNYYPSEKAMAYVKQNDTNLLSLIKASLETIGTIKGCGMDFIFSFFN